MSTTTYEYDLNGNMTQKSLANGTVETRVYDTRNRVSSITNTSGLVTLSSYAYSYDGVGNVTQVDETYAAGGPAARTIVNTYDQANRLVSEEITTGETVVTTGYTYDNGHNRTEKVVTGGPNPGTTTYVIGDGSNGAGANQIKSATLPDSTVVGFSYDANGNRTGKTIGTNTDSYSYDNENRLVSLSKEIGGTALYTYAYDYRTRRVTRNEPGGTTQVAFNGGTSIIESGASNAEFVRGPGQGGGVGGLEYSVREGNASYNQYNSRGDVVGQTDGSAAQTYQAAYEAFGRHPVQTGSTADRQHANTKEEDPTGLLNEGFRYRDLETGTFITRDPLGLAAGPNGYIYCGQNPWSRFDPEGLETKAEWQEKVRQDILSNSNVDINNFDPSKGFVAEIPYIYAVYAFYTRMYKKDPNDFKWAGLAKLAGGTVVGGLWKIEWSKMNSLFTLTPGSQENEIAGIRRVQIILIEMNKAIFEDLAWQHLAYSQKGIAEMRERMRAGDITPLNLRSWDQIAAGKIWEGNINLLRQEQELILAPGYQKLSKNPAATLLMSNMALSPLPGGNNFSRVVPKGNLAVFNDRWQWIINDMIPKAEGMSLERFSQLVDTPLKFLMLREFPIENK